LIKGISKYKNVSKKDENMIYGRRKKISNIVPALFS
jgi:hypothetical protein